jgi:gliding motility associated protien GldN
MYKKIILAVFTVIFAGIAKGQNFGDIYQKSIPDAKKINYPYLREADVVWSKRYFRMVDLREKVNHPLYYPVETTRDGRKNFINIILEEIKAGKITVYSTLAGQEGVPTTYQEVESLMGAVPHTETVQVDATTTRIDTIQGEIHPEDVKELLLYEEWYFDKKLSKLDVRIIAVCPYYMGVDPELKKALHKSLFWVKFDDIRDVLAKNEVFSAKNDAQRISFDDLFMQRRFNGFIYGESNVYNDRMVNEYLPGESALFEAERIKNELFNIEHDLWEY